MNKVILTNDRIFMAVVGPSGSGKTELIFNMLQGRSFYPAFLKIFYFDKEFQDTFTAIQQKIQHIEFIKYSGLDITKKRSDCLLVYDDSCEAIFNDKEFVKIATSGRHIKVHVIYIKHNLFQQSKWSRTIDLNTTHKAFFKSMRDIKQIEYLGKQLNCLHLLKDAYKLASAQPYGHLIFDLDPKTSQGLRFSSQLIGPEPSVLYSTSEEAAITPITNEKETFAYDTKSKSKRIFLAQDIDFIWFLSDCVMNVLSGVVPINKKELKQFEPQLRQLSEECAGKK